MFQGSRFSVLSHVEGWINTPRYPQLRGSPWLASLKSTPSLPGSSVVTHPAVLLQLPYFRALPAWDHSWVISEEGCVCVDMAGGTAQVHNDYKVTLIISTLFPFFFLTLSYYFYFWGQFPVAPSVAIPASKKHKWHLMTGRPLPEKCAVLVKHSAGGEESLRWWPPVSECFCVTAVLSAMDDGDWRSLLFLTYARFCLNLICNQCVLSYKAISFFFFFGWKASRIILMISQAWNHGHRPVVPDPEPSFYGWESWGFMDELAAWNRGRGATCINVCRPHPIQTPCSLTRATYSEPQGPSGASQ